MRLPVVIDGSHGEGGGQVLRSALALALVTGRKLKMKNIRAGRRPAGMQRQHVACVHAAAALAHTVARGVEIGGQTFELAPEPFDGRDLRPAVSAAEGRRGSIDGWPSELAIDIGSAGSATLVAQMLIAPALASGRPLRATITGGTHNPLAPPFEFLDRVFLPHLRAMGADISVTLEKIGVLPAGGGRLVLEVGGGATLRPIEIVDAGRVVARRATAIVAKLPRHVAERELAVACERLADPVCEVRELPDDGPHNLFMAEVELESGARELATSHGRKGYPAEDVADDALDELEDFLEAGVPVGEHLADQLLLPMAIAGGGRFRTLAPLTSHALTNIATIREFLDLPLRVEEHEDTATVIVG